jgi:hypothetical protein
MFHVEHIVMTVKGIDYVMRRQSGGKPGRGVREYRAAGIG